MRSSPGFGSSTPPLKKKVTWAYFSVSAILAWVFPWAARNSPKVFVMLLLIGVFAAGGQFFLTYAYQQAPASEVSIYQYSGVVFTAVFSYAFLGETLSKSSIIGGIVILGAIFWVFENTRKEKNT